VYPGDDLGPRDLPRSNSLALEDTIELTDSGACGGCDWELAERECVTWDDDDDDERVGGEGVEMERVVFSEVGCDDDFLRADNPGVCLIGVGVLLFSIR
jgi:hypothetical protein